MNEFDAASDEELILRMREGEGKILDYLMEKYKELVRKKARAIYLIGADRDDLMQEGMIGLFKAVRDYREEKECSFKTFAGLCIDRQLYSAISISNRKKHQPLNSYVSLSDSGAQQDMEESWLDNPESLMIEAENVRLLKQKIYESLSEMENQVLTMYLEGSSYSGIAQTLGKSPKSIDNALRRIRSKIRKNYVAKNS